MTETLWVLVRGVEEVEVDMAVVSCGVDINGGRMTLQLHGPRHASCSGIAAAKEHP